ncbi:MAG: ACT domain-containing protein [Bacteroidota bacterium]
MNPQKDLKLLLKGLTPTLNKGSYIFYSQAHPPSNLIQSAISIFKEKEGISLILPKEVAEQENINYEFVAAWITLEVHSALDAVGLTAAFSHALTAHNISCNVVAGFFHDHIFVDIKDAEKSMQVLKNLSQEV